MLTKAIVSLSLFLMLQPTLDNLMFKTRLGATEDLSDEYTSSENRACNSVGVVGCMHSDLS